jgi:hypothetical protein
LEVRGRTRSADSPCLPCERSKGTVSRQTRLSMACHTYVCHLWATLALLLKRLALFPDTSLVVWNWKNVSLCCGNGRCKDGESVFTEDLLQVPN